METSSASSPSGPAHFPSCVTWSSTEAPSTASSRLVGTLTPPPVALLTAMPFSFPSRPWIPLWTQPSASGAARAWRLVPTHQPLYSPPPS
jgi:hypothetical protein